MAAKEDSFSLKPGNTKSMAAAAAAEAVIGEECSLKLCPAKRKAPAAGHDCSEDWEEVDKCADATVLPDVTMDDTAKEQAIKVAEADSDDGSSDDEPLSEAERKAFIEGLREQQRKFWREEFLPLNPLLKHYSLIDEEEICNDDNAKV